MTISQLFEMVNKRDKNGDFPDNWDEAYEELMDKIPFDAISGLVDRIDELEKEIGRIKNHKHVDGKVFIPIP